MYSPVKGKRKKKQMAKVTINNSFNGGLITDLSVFNQPMDSVSDALNMELITIGENQYLFQNIKGNSKLIKEDGSVVDLGSHTHTNGVAYKFEPLGVHVYNDIAYILAGAFDGLGDFLTGTIGTFPSPDWDELNSSGTSILRQEFSPLHNYRTDTTVPNPYTDPFISPIFNFKRNKFIDVVVQGDFDRSANVIFTDSKETMKIINSRFKTTDLYKVVELADRRGDKDSNIYSNEDWDRIDLIQISNLPIKVVDFSIEKGGSLKGGGYKYFFKYTTQEGNTTDVLYESPLIPISNGGLGLTKEQTSDLSIKFELEDLDNSYTGIQVYFAHFDGYPKASVEYFKINYVYTYTDGAVTIKHNGLEALTSIKAEEINTPYSPIDTVQSTEIVNDRLAIAGIKSTLLEEHVQILEEASKEVFVWEHSRVIDTSYNNPNTAAKYLGYWPGEVYEFSIVYMLTNKGLSPAFPITGCDNIKKIQETPIFVNGYPSATIGPDGFSADHLINHKGLFRFSDDSRIYSPKCNKEGNRYVTYASADTSKLLNFPGLKDIVSGFFITRRVRTKNVLMQGMMMPTIKLPSSKPSISPRLTDTSESDSRADFVANKRFLTPHTTSDFRVGLNTKYRPLEKSNDPIFTADFNVVYAPQPTQAINIISHAKVFVAIGSIGQEAGSDSFKETVDREGEPVGTQHLAFYSPEIDLNLPTVNNLLTGSTPSFEIQETLNGASPVVEADIYPMTDTDRTRYLDSKQNVVAINSEEIAFNRAPFITIPSDKVKTTLISSGSEITTDGSFTGKTDRALGLMSDDDSATNSIVFPYAPFSERNGSYGPEWNFITPTSRYGSYSGGIDGKWNGGSFKPYSLISHSYSVYLGVKIDTSLIPKVPEFMFTGHVVNEASLLANGANVNKCLEFGGELQCVEWSDRLEDQWGEVYQEEECIRWEDPIDSTRTNGVFLNTGHLSNLFRTPVGRWSTDNIIDIYKYDNNKPYFSITDRVGLDTIGIDLYQGDGFISKFYKRATYKNGVGLLTASAGDAGAFGIGINKPISDGYDDDKLLETWKKDKGRNLYDVGQIIEMVTYSNINADIRNTEAFSPEEKKAIGYDRDFYPHRDESMLGDPRPDSVRYNQGYSPDNSVIGYFRIEENAAVFSTEFPNRIMLSEKNQVQEFYNSFRDLRGFNFRDYGVEYGPIIKIVTVNSLLLSVHRKGILAIGVDDRTLLAEGSDIYVDTVKALSPKAATISDLYGSDHPESIVKSDATVLGVDYNSDVVWMYAGGKIKIISEFAVKTLLKRFKERINAGKFGNDTDTQGYIARVYSTFNHVKHTMYIAYIAEHPQTGEQYHVGSVTYNTVIGKWMSRISEGNKFLMRVTSNEYSFGFSERNMVWEEDTLSDPVTGKSIRARLRDVDYTTEFEIILNDKPTYEKILENILVLCNKKIPTKVIYTTSGDVNDPAIEIWGDAAKSTTTVQPITVRGDSQRQLSRLRILDQNAYYRDSKLYIEVGKIGQSITKANNKRIRDKHIKVRFIYEGNDELFIQAIISILSISQN